MQPRKGRAKERMTWHTVCMDCGEHFHVGSRNQIKTRCKTCYLEWRARVREDKRLKTLSNLHLIDSHDLLKELESRGFLKVVDDCQ